MPLFEAFVGAAAIVLAIIGASLQENPFFVLSAVLYTLYLVLFVLTLFCYRSELRLDIFYREKTTSARDSQHRAALALAVVLLSNPVVVGIQGTMQRDLWTAEEISAEQSMAASGWRTFQGLYFLFNLFYVRYSVQNDRLRVPDTSRCSPRAGIFASVLLGVFTQICATILAGVGYNANNPLFPGWLVAVQAVWVAWSFVYDWIITIGACPRKLRPACYAHESTIVSGSGLVLPREELLSEL